MNHCLLMIIFSKFNLEFQWHFTFNYLQFWDTRTPNPIDTIQLPERCYCADVVSKEFVRQWMNFLKKWQFPLWHTWLFNLCFSWLVHVMYFKVSWKISFGKIYLFMCWKTKCSLCWIIRVVFIWRIFKKYPMAVVGTAGRELIIYQLENRPQEFTRIESPLKFQVH